MRLSSSWKLVIRTICLALLRPGAALPPTVTERYDERSGKTGATPARAFLLAFGHPVVDEQLARKVRAAQIASIARLTPFTVLANIVNTLVILLTFRDLLPGPALTLWAGAIWLLLAVSTAKWLVARRSPIEFASRRALRRAVGHATILGALWAAVPITAFGTGDPDAIWIASCVATGMLCGGAFALATVPQAAFRWVALLYIASTVSLAIGQSPSLLPIYLLLTSYTLVVVGSVASTGWLFASHFLAEAELEQRGELIALLLNEFEEKSSDWIWETDSRGNLRNISGRFLHASGRSLRELETMRMIDLAYSLDEAEARSAVVRLEQAMALQTSFRDTDIGVTVNGEARWWSLSARPVHDSHGSFTGYRGVASDITEARRASALISHLAEHDSLTGIGNRSWFLKQARQQLDRDAPTGDGFLALFLIDLDNFKVVNDTSGHPAGDELLRQVAQRFVAVKGEGVALARFGGDEFAALGRFDSTAAAEAFAETLVDVIRKPFHVGRRDFAIGATVGFAPHRDGSDTVDDLMRKADIALYKAKDNGRNQALAFETEMEREVRDRRDLEADLRTALENEALEVEFLPIVNARSATVVSSEVLLRWRHPERGDIDPATFIPIAEQAGLMLPLGTWVLRKACAAAAECPELESIAVNLSPVQFIDPNLVDQVLSVLRETGLPPERLVLEVTESVFLRDIGSAAAKLRSLRDQGIRISLDDFGTGYSSLTYLRQYRFDKIKIDRSFVAEIGERTDGLAIISAIIALAHSLGLEVTAEGVERQLQVDALRTLGCDTMQGYYFGLPDASPMRIVRIGREDWEDRAPSTAPRNPASLRPAS